MNLLIFGGTGHLGQDLVRLALREGHTVRIASRRERSLDLPPDVQWARADLRTGAGLAESVQGMDAIVFSAGDPKHHASVEIDGMKRLLEVSKAASIAHLLFVSIVGIDHLPIPYYRTKRHAEQLIETSGLPYSILRATQFHYFLDLMLRGLNRVPLLLPVPSEFRIQPVATEDVAERILRAIEAGPAGRLADFAGPEIFSLKEAAKLWQRATGTRKPVVSIPIPGNLGRAFRAGHNTDPAADRGSIRLAEWLERNSLRNADSQGARPIASCT